MADNQIHTGGGSAISGNVETGSGDFAGRDRQSVTVNNDSDSAEVWRAITSLETRLIILEHETRANARQYWVAVILIIVAIASIWYLSMKIDSYTKAAQNLSRIAAEQRK